MRKLNILLVEDDDIDAKTVKRALQEIHVLNPIIMAQNGVEALEYLNDSTKKKPGIILLDINMPKMNGIEFLKIAKNDSNLKVIPVVMISKMKNRGIPISRIDRKNCLILRFKNLSIVFI